MTQPVRRGFVGRHDQISRARAFVRTVVDGCPVADDAILLTSEICTNALQHTASGDGGTFEITIYYAPGSLRIEVRDEGSPTTPVPRGPDDYFENGRGLEIVALLANRWGQHGDEHGRTVYFEFRWAACGRACPDGGPGPALADAALERLTDDASAADRRRVSREMALRALL